MRVCLVWNENAGDGNSLGEIQTLLARAGHHVDAVVQRNAELPRNVELVVAAGGDGTVARVGRTLAGGHIPMAILPIGTANNIAKSLGIHGTAAEVIKGWKDKEIRRIDVGMVHDPDGEAIFLEGVGVGLIADEIKKSRDAEKAKRNEQEPKPEVSEARQLYADALSQLTASHYVVTIDGNTIEGDYLLVEVLNVQAIGPRVRLSPEVSPVDGLLSVVLAGEQERQAIERHINSRPTTSLNDAGLKTWRAKQVTLSGFDHYHVDDDVRSANGDVSVWIKPAFLPILG